MSQKALLKHLDSPVRILSLSINDMISYLSPFFIGAIFDSLVIVPLSGLIVIYLIKKAIQRFPRFFLMRWFYWALPTSRYNKIVKISWPPSSKRFWVK